LDDGRQIGRRDAACVEGNHVADAPDSAPASRWKNIADAVVAADRTAADNDMALGLGHVGRILIATFGTWLALIAIPGALPWNSADNGDRALVVGAGVMSILALASIPASLYWKDSRAAGAAWVGLAASLFGVGFAALQIVRTLVVPSTISKDVVLGVGLLILLGFAFLLAWRRQVVGIASTTRFSTLSLVGSIVALVLIAAYLLVTNSLLNVIKAPAEDWVRYTDLRNGLESLAFAAAGALLGTAIQKQLTDRAASRADENGTSATTNYVIAMRALDLAAQGRGPLASSEDRQVVLDQERATQIDDLRAQLRIPR
jgi:hypothetical protein